jgi:hypothetical protein
VPGQKFVCGLQQAADYVGLSLPTFLKLLDEGRGPPYFKVAKGPNAVYRFSTKKLDAWDPTEIPVAAPDEE